MGKGECESARENEYIHTGRLQSVKNDSKPKKKNYAAQSPLSISLALEWGKLVSLPGSWFIVTVEIKRTKPGTRSQVKDTYAEKPLLEYRSKCR